MSTIADLPASSDRLYRTTTFQADRQGRRASATWKVPYSELEGFLQAVGGLPETVPGPTPGTSVTRIVPLVFPDMTREPLLYADSIDADAVAFDGAGSYGLAKVKVNFRTWSFDSTGSAPFITENYDGASEYVTLPGSAFKFPSDNKVINTEVGAHIPALDFSLQFHQLPSLNLPLWTSLQGKVNSLAFWPAYYNLAVGTVLYLGPTAQATTEVGGVRSYSVTHKFRFRYVPHNQIMRPDGTAFEAPVRIGAPSEGILPVTDLNSIFA